MLYVNSKVLKKARKDVHEKTISVDSSAEEYDKGFYGLGSSSDGEKFPENGTETKTGISPAHALSTKGMDLAYNGNALSTIK